MLKSTINKTVAKCYNFQNNSLKVNVANNWLLQILVKSYKITKTAAKSAKKCEIAENLKKQNS